MPPSPTKRRELIVRAARRSFTKLGYDATTIGDLATELGISKAAIVYYFPAKSAFLDELLEPVLGELDDVVATHRDDPAGLLAGYLDVLIRHHAIAVWMDTDPAIRRHDDHADRLTAINDRAVAILTGGSRRTSDRLQALAVLGSIWRPVRESKVTDLRAHRDQIADAALEGAGEVT